MALPTPQNLQDTVHHPQSTRSLRSSSQTRLRPSRFGRRRQQTRSGARAFKNAAPTLRNNIPAALKSATASVQFSRSQLKTNLSSPHLSVDKCNVTLVVPCVLMLDVARVCPAVLSRFRLSSPRSSSFRHSCVVRVIGEDVSGLEGLLEGALVLTVDVIVGHEVGGGCRSVQGV